MIVGNLLEGNIPVQIIFLTNLNTEYWDSNNEIYGKHQKEGKVLEFLFEAFGGEDWYENGVANHCNWSAVQCDNEVEQSIVKLELKNQNLTGSIPAEIGLLNKLTELDLCESDEIFRFLLVSYERHIVNYKFENTNDHLL